MPDSIAKICVLILGAGFCAYSAYLVREELLSDDESTSALAGRVLFIAGAYQATMAVNALAFIHLVVVPLRDAPEQIVQTSSAYELVMPPTGFDIFLVQLKVLVGTAVLMWAVSRALARTLPDIDAGDSWAPIEAMERIAATLFREYGLIVLGICSATAIAGDRAAALAGVIELGLVWAGCRGARAIHERRAAPERG